MAFSIGPQPVANDALVLYLDAAAYVSGSTTWLSVTGNNNGTLINGPVYNAADGGSIVFDGINDYVDCGDNIRGRTTFSADAWINTTDTRTGANNTYHNPSIFGTQHGSGVSGDFALTLRAGYLGFYHELAGAGYIDTGIYVADGTWRYVAVTKSTSGTIAVYHNGTQVYTGTGYTGTLRNIDLTYYNWELGRAFWYGEDVSMLRYNGKIGSHKLYSRDLTATEVLQNFNANRWRFGI
jgi:hypothetical protein